jgi:hypothetical protein
LTIGSHSSAERPLIGQKQNATARSTTTKAETTPAPPPSVRIKMTPAARLAAMTSTCVGRRDPISPRRSSGPNR